MCKYNSSKKGLLSKSVKFFLTAEERSVLIQYRLDSIIIETINKLLIKMLMFSILTTLLFRAVSVFKIDFG